MFCNDGIKLEISLFIVSKKKYVAPHTHVNFIESVYLLEASDPEASVHDIDYGGDINDEDIDDQ